MASEIPVDSGDSSGGFSEGTPAPSVDTGPAPSAPAAPAAPAAPVAPRTSYTLDELKTLDLRELAKVRGGDLFDQTGLNRHVQERLARERQTQQSILENLQRQYDSRLAQLNAAQTGGADPGVLTPLISGFQQVKEQMENLQLEREIDRLSNKYPDFGPSHMDILEIALQNRTNIETAYKIWKYEHVSQINMEDLKKQHIDEYVRSVTDRNRTAPKVEGAGGSAPVESGEHDGSWETAEKRAAARFKRASKT